jgi:hypothetical protein
MMLPTGCASRKSDASLSRERCAVFAQRVESKPRVVAAAAPLVAIFRPVVDQHQNPRVGDRVGKDFEQQGGSPRPAFRRGEGLIAQSRWPRWATWRSTGLEFGTQLDAPAGPKRVPKVYVVSILKPVLRRHCNVCKGCLVTSLTWLSQVRQFARTGRGSAPTWTMEARSAASCSSRGR